MRTLILMPYPLTGDMCWYVCAANGKTISIWDFDQFGDAIEALVIPTKEDEIFNSFFD